MCYVHLPCLLLLTFNYYILLDILHLKLFWTVILRAYYYIYSVFNHFVSEFILSRLMCQLITIPCFGIVFFFSSFHLFYVELTSLKYDNFYDDTLWPAFFWCYLRFRNVTLLIPSFQTKKKNKIMSTNVCVVFFSCFWINYANLRIKYLVL